ncbi:hypothetical protein ACSIGC_17590 [Tenacibaculum sp. ZS6-P6]|uniref:hypothetical protein n=1 Tax=Tenacibaculum sp. ZS6-P6 TaxID=3447503 RepID=UPI003F989144
MKGIIICLACILFNFELSSQRDLYQIQNDSLKKFIESFKKVKSPFNFSEPRIEEEIDSKLLQRFLNVEVVDEIGYVGTESYYYGFAYFDQKYLSLIYTHYYSPGAFGIDNKGIYVVTMNYEGEIIGEELIGCFCKNSNMGSNEYFVSELNVTIQKSKIIVKQQEIRQTLVSNDDDNFKNTTLKTFEIEIDSHGKMVKQQIN